jgi:hypothetical protein
MLRRNLVLGSAASFALVGAMVCAASGYAQSLPRYPTPAEQAQTDALNAQQASEPGVIVSVNQPDDSTYRSALEQNSTAQAQYDAQVKAYNEKASAYQRQKQDYDSKVADYKARQRDFDVAMSDLYAPPPAVVIHDAPDTAVVVHDRAIDDPAVVIDERDPAVVVHERDPAVIVEDRNPAIVVHVDRLIDFDALRDPDEMITNAPVIDRVGLQVGHFRHITTQDGGRVEAVITLNNNKSIALDHRYLRFDPDHEVVVAELSADELNRMPARF